MATIIYLHGFASVGRGAKFEALAAAFGEGHVIAPDLPVTPNAVEAIVDGLVRDATSPPIVFVGTSLGGFWANYFAQRYNAPCVLVNPAVTPSRTLAPRVGMDNRNYSTGASVEVLESDLEMFRQREEYLARHSNCELIHLFLAQDDDVLSCEETLRVIPRCASCTISKTGGHRYQEHFAAVIEKTMEVAT